MADFNAGEKVPVVHYNFAPFLDWSGVLEEPSFAQINAFRRTYGEIALKAAAAMPDLDEEGFGKLSMKKQAELIGNMLDTDNSEDQDTVIRAVVDISGLEKDRFSEVPWRIQQAFYSHLVQEYLSPEAQGTAATS